MYFGLWNTWMDSWPVTGTRPLANYDTDWWNKKACLFKFCWGYFHTEHIANYEWMSWIQTHDGVISVVHLEVAGMGVRRIWNTSLPPEVLERTLRVALAPYGEIVSIHHETWSKACCYTVANGIQVVTMKLNTHLPSRMNVTGNRILASYDGQPVTCYGCGDTGHISGMPQKVRRRNGDIRSAHQHTGPYRC